MQPETATPKRARSSRSIGLPFGLFVAIGSGGCALEIPLGPERRTAAPDMRHLILSKFDRIFGTRVRPQDISISRATQVLLDARTVWRVCLAFHAGENRSPPEQKTHVVFVDRDEVIHDQPAGAEHGCGAETYAPLTG